MNGVGRHKTTTLCSYFCRCPINSSGLRFLVLQRFTACPDDRSVICNDGVVFQTKHRTSPPTFRIRIPGCRLISVLRTINVMTTWTVCVYKSVPKRLSPLRVTVRPFRCKRSIYSFFIAGIARSVDPLYESHDRSTLVGR